MTPSGIQDRLHPRPTERSGYRYLFTAKHHGGGSTTDARWLPDLCEDDEFAVFNEADVKDLADEDGNLYGALQDGEGGLRFLGTWQQQIAEFPHTEGELPWHGYPLWAVNDLGPANRRRQQYRPAKSVFDRMAATGLIARAMRKRLMKGDHV
jgi:hypothetical protein